MIYWEDKVNKVIARLAYQEWYRSNHDRQGRQYKRHRTYTIPEEANELVKALGMKDRKQAETLAKGIMEGMRIQGKAID